MIAKAMLKFFAILCVLIMEEVNAGFGCMDGMCNCRGREVVCSGKNITAIPGSQSLLNAAETELIDLSDNHLDSLPANAFSQLMSLKVLILKNNSIEYVNEACFNVTASNRPSPLQHIDLRDNHLHFFPACFESKSSSTSSLKNLETLLIGGNLFGSRLKMNSFTAIGEVKKLDLSRNLLRIIPDLFFKKLHHLEDLDLSSNNLHKVSSMIFPQHIPLYRFKLCHNILKNIPDNLPRVLRELDLSSNVLNGLNPDDARSLKILSQLQVLDLSRNKIRFIIYGIFTQMSKLQYLDISFNRLKVLDIDSINGSVSLRYFFLHNIPSLIQITNLEFTTIPKIEYLALQSCSIKAITLPSILEERSNNTVTLKKIWLFGNPLTCDCYIVPLVRFLKKNKVQLDPVKHNNLSEVSDVRVRERLHDKIGKGMDQIGISQCVAPLNRYRTVVGKMLLDIPESHLTCPNELRFVAVAMFLGIFAFLGVIPFVIVLIHIYLSSLRFFRAHFCQKKEKEE